MPDSRKALIDAALRVLSSDPSASLAEVAAAAGVRRVTLHRHFKSRELLLREITLQSLAEMDHACQQAADGAESYTEAVRAIVAALVPVGDRFHFLWTQKATWSDEAVKQRSEQDDQQLSELIDRAKEEGGIASDIPNTWILASIESVVFAALNASRAGNIAVNEAGELAARTLFEGISKTSKQRRGRK